MSLGPAFIPPSLPTGSGRPRRAALSEGQMHMHPISTDTHSQAAQLDVYHPDVFAAPADAEPTPQAAPPPYHPVYLEMVDLADMSSFARVQLSTVRQIVLQLSLRLRDISHSRPEHAVVNMQILLNMSIALASSARVCDELTQRLSSIELTARERAGQFGYEL
ncbi:hypothetical protein DENSPDRAFT_887001 [Dentipellis sp. KUC8613]|nr:hypothetical protein DENSPDRAFT_887001 [Dentipellis sp. KUC8613]